MKNAKKIKNLYNKKNNNNNLYNIKGNNKNINNKIID